MAILKGRKTGEFFKVMSPSYRGFTFLDGPTIWFRDTGELRAHTAVPTDINADGSVIGAVITTGALANLSNLSSPTLVPVDIEPESTLTKDLGDPVKYWANTYSQIVHFNSSASISGASAGTAALTGNLTVSGTLTVSGDQEWGADDKGVDVTWYSETTALNMKWDQDGNTNKGALIFTGANTSPAIQLVNTNVTHTIQLATDVAVWSATDHANAKIVIGEHTKTNGLDLTWQTVTNGAALVCDAAGASVTFDDLTVNFKKTTTNTLVVTTDTNVTYFDAGTANDTLHLGNTTNLDLRLHGAAYDFLWDASQNSGIFLDNAVLAIGTDRDLQILGNNTSIEINAAAANYVVNWGATTATDLTLHGASAGEDITWDASADALRVLDAAHLQFGTGASTNGDLNFSYVGGTNILAITQVASGTGSITLGADGKGIDMTWFLETSSSYFKIDQATDRLVVAAANVCFGDASALRFGTGTTFGGDISIAYTGGTNVLNIGQVAAGTGTITIGADDKGIDVTFFAEAASDYMKWDQDGATNVGALTFVDSAIIFDQTTVDYTLVAASDLLSLTATDNALAKLTLGAAGTNGLDVVFQSATAGDLITFDAAAKTFTLLDVSLVAGANSTNQGTLTLWDGAGGNTPAYILMHTSNGTARYLFFEDDGTLKTHTSAPTANADGTEIGAQT